MKDSLGAFRGLFFAILFLIPIWVIIIYLTIKG